MITTTAAQLCQSTQIIKKTQPKKTIGEKVNYFSFRGEKKKLKL